MKIAEALSLITLEYGEASLKHRPFNSPHEGYAVIKEELDELWEAIRKVKNFDERNESMKDEAVQISAMALRFLIDLVK